MPSPSLTAAFDAAQQRHAEAVAGLVALLLDLTGDDYLGTKAINSGQRTAS